MEKTINRHERDLTKLKPVTLQAPDINNQHTDLLQCLTDIMAERMGRGFKQVFVTRNEFQALEAMLPDTQVHFRKEITNVEKYVQANQRRIEELK